MFHKIAYGFLLLFSFWFSACLAQSNGQNEGTVAVAEMAQEQQSVYYGQTSPTLYTGLTQAQQSAVVALCSIRNGYCFCTGTLISPRIVLTAGHCVHNPDLPLTATDLTIHVGADSDYPDDILTVTDFEYKDWQHNFADDIAVVVLDAAYSAATALPFHRDQMSSLLGQQVQTVGYGMSEISDMNTLRNWTTLDVTAVSHSNVTVDGHGSTGMAPGDSGGPMLFDFGSGVQVVGVASTSEEGWVNTANYTPVVEHIDWIDAVANQYTSSTCQNACSGMHCGIDQGCFCGTCSYGDECVSGQCQEIPAGHGGLCLSLSSTTRECGSDNDCSASEHCYQYTNASGSECAEECGPEPCVDGDSASFCYPFPSSANSSVPLCLESAPAACSEANTLCSANGSDHGYCLDLYGDGHLACYGTCQLVVTCPDDRACAPYVDPCEQNCASRECGFVGNCDCGSCASGFYCMAGQCEPNTSTSDAGSSVAQDAGTSSGYDGTSRAPVGLPPDRGDESGCGCASNGTKAGSAWILIFMAGFVYRRRR